MTKTIRSLLVLTAAICLAGSMSFAQSSGEATYKAKCQSCHGSNGTPSPGIAKMMGVKPNTDPSIKSLTVDQMIAGIKASSKMKSVAGLPDLKEAVIYYRGLK